MINFQVKDLLGYVDNPLMKGVVAGTITAACIVATTAFAPVGVVGATGWVVVHSVAIGSALWDATSRVM